MAIMSLLLLKMHYLSNTKKYILYEYTTTAWVYVSVKKTLLHLYLLTYSIFRRELNKMDAIEHGKQKGATKNSYNNTNPPKNFSPFHCGHVEKKYKKTCRTFIKVKTDMYFLLGKLSYVLRRERNLLPFLIFKKRLSPKYVHKYKSLQLLTHFPTQSLRKGSIARGNAKHKSIPVKSAQTIYEHRNQNGETWDTSGAPCSFRV